MKNHPKLFAQIDDFEILLTAVKFDDQNNFKLLEKIILPIKNSSVKGISDLDNITELIKKSVLEVEQKINFTFSRLIIILNNFEISFFNLSGFRKLNGTQVSKENITYILNTLMSYIDENEKNKKILHIFNSEYILDKKKLDNLPIGLFGDFYAHELSFNLIDKNDFKNLENIFKKCNLKIEKILLESFVKGSIVSNKNFNLDSFFYIQINQNITKIFVVEKDSIKFEQKFKFGTEIIEKDISKITSLKIEEIKKIIQKNPNIQNAGENDFLEEEYFKNKNYRKISKKLLASIAEARIKELSQILLYQNINLKAQQKKLKVVFLEINDQNNFECFKKDYENCFSRNNDFDFKFAKRVGVEEMVNAANKIVHFGWKKEAIPVPNFKKTIFSRFFEKIFS
tara:strand:+ start:248 stop:1441 length:1194 start_codon:yes stop_codon:yes gene_type:complete